MSAHLYTCHQCSKHCTVLTAVCKHVGGWAGCLFKLVAVWCQGVKKLSVPKQPFLLQYNWFAASLAGLRQMTHQTGMCSGLTSPSAWQELLLCNPCRYLSSLERSSPVVLCLSSLLTVSVHVTLVHLAMQKINHFAGMLELCRKKTLARSISAMAARFPGVYQFCPKTYVLPEDLQALWRDFKSPKKGKPKTLILKPDSGSQVSALWHSPCTNL